MDLRLGCAAVEVAVGDEGTRVRLRPLALGFQRRMKERGVVPPCPPRTVVRDSHGRAIKDERGQAVLMVDEAEPGYLAAVEEYHERLAVLMIAESIEGVTFTAERPTDDAGWSAYADAVAAELAAAGLTAGDFVRLCRGVCEASRMSEGSLDVAADAFFSSAGTGRSSPD